MTITAQTRSKLSTKRTDIFLEFLGSMSSFCEPNQFSCFPGVQTKYRISEGSVWGDEFDCLQNLAFPALCPNTTVEYNLTSGQIIPEKSTQKTKPRDLIHEIKN
ncbi:hypothetical protein TNCT_332831 [Trichonephila clavata]|uniref:Uncharacterized protein n=1 Tax=Trichonephila clavata TaxID=2740835 RepID=A0A8X6L1W9_TRICU|nr:hypothetical protein TNCT_332831 [Trichonephila clavata]